MNQSEAHLSVRSDRRQWFAGALRYTLLGGLTLLSGRLLLQSQRPECRQSAACRQCGVRETCRRPQAVELRRKVRG